MTQGETGMIVASARGVPCQGETGGVGVETERNLLIKPNPEIVCALFLNLRHSKISHFYKLTFLTY